MAPSPGRNNAAIAFAALSASGGALFAFYIYKRVRELRSQQFPNRIATAISNEQLAVLAKSSNVSLRQSAEQMLLDRILEREAFTEVVQGCYSKDENKLYQACSVFCVVLKSVNFSVPLSLSQIVKLLTSCLQRSLDRESDSEAKSRDSIFSVKIQRMTLATICDFLSDSINRKDVLVSSCPDIIPVCIRLVKEGKNKEVLRYSVLLLFQIAGLGTTLEVREAGAIPVLASRIITFHGDQIMQRITLQTIVVLIGSVDDSKPLCAEIARPMVLMPVVSSCISDDVELSFWSLALIQDFVNNDLCTDELTTMTYLVKNFHTILKTKEGAFKSFVLKMLGGLCDRRASFLKDLTENTALLQTVSESLKNRNDLVVNYCIRFFKILMQGGHSVIEKLLNISDYSILKGLLHVAKEGQIENKVLMTELLTEFVMSEKFVSRIVQNGGLDIVKVLAKPNNEDNLSFFSSAMLIDMAMISDEVKGQLAKMYVLPTIYDWIKNAKNEKVAVFATKTLVMLHLIEDLVKISINADGKTTQIDVGDVHFTDTQHSSLRIFHWDSLFVNEITIVPIKKKALASTKDQISIQVSRFDSLSAKNSGEVVFVALCGTEGSKYVQGLLKYMQMKKDDQDQCLNLAEDDIAVLIAEVDNDGCLNLKKMSIASSETEASHSIRYKELFQHRTFSQILPLIMDPLNQKYSQDGCPLKKKALEVLNVLLCLEDYLNNFISSPTAVSNLLMALQDSSSNSLTVLQSIIGVLVTLATFESGRSHLISLGAPLVLVNFINHQRDRLVTDLSGSPKGDVFDIDVAPVPPSVAAIINSLPPRPQSRAEPRPLRTDDGSVNATHNRSQASSSSTNGPLPVIPEDGYIAPEAGETAEAVRLNSLSGLIEEAVSSAVEVLKNENRKGDNSNTTGPTTSVVIQNAVSCLAKILSGKMNHNENDGKYKEFATSLRTSGTVYTLWSYLLTSKDDLKALQVPIANSITILSETIATENTAFDTKVRFDRKDVTRTMFMSTDDLEVLNYNWTFESVRANVGVSQPSSPSPSDHPKGWYYQMELFSDGLIQVGWCSEQCQYSPQKGIGVGDDYHSYSFDGVRQKKWHGPVAEQTEENVYGELWKSGDIVTCLLDCHGNISYHHNGKNLGVAFAAINMQDCWYPACSVCTDQWARFNFGDSPVRYSESIPDGFVPISYYKHPPQYPVSNTNQPLIDSVDEPATSNEKEGTAESLDEENTKEEKEGAVKGQPEAGDSAANVVLPLEGARPISTDYLPSLYFEIKLDSNDARPVSLGFNTLNFTDQVTAVIKDSEIVLPDLSIKQVSVERSVVIGCGYVASTNHVFFTIDGQAIEVFFEFAGGHVTIPVMPCLSSSRYYVNFGQRDFQFKIPNTEEYFKGAISTCVKFLSSCLSPDSEESEPDGNKMELNPVEY
ncbi:uncharacterized protein [Apostichopus japonicus]|uniref:uncharacterized protein n=1 Tax=Stichopus japonicus TaxID=307972 RepID=UPI003AB2D271